MLEGLIRCENSKQMQVTISCLQLVARNLWEYLDDETPEYHSRTVELLNQLQQLSPNPWTCEDVISSALLSDDKASISILK